jgi:hypothetical protein
MPIPTVSSSALMIGRGVWLRNDRPPKGQTKPRKEIAVAEFPMGVVRILLGDKADDIIRNHVKDATALVGVAKRVLRDNSMNSTRSPASKKTWASIR